MRELRAIPPTSRAPEEMHNIKCEINKLEKDLRGAVEMSNRDIAERWACTTTMPLELFLFGSGMLGFNKICPFFIIH